MRACSLPNRTGQLAFSCARSAPAVLPMIPGLSFNIEQIVADLEGQANRFGELTQRVDLIGRQIRCCSRHHHRGPDQRAGF